MMASKVSKFHVPRRIKKSIFDTGIGKELPDAYRKFFQEWKLTKPAAVHYIPKEGKWERDEVTGVITPIQNVPIPLRFPPQLHQCLTGGESVVQGFQKRHLKKRRVAHFWVPVLRRSVVYSEALDKYMAVIVTQRTIDLIHDHYGFDHYLLKTPACDLKSELALTIKRHVLLALEKKCPAYADRPKQQEEVYNTYKHYLENYTSEEIEWYGLTFEQACKKLRTEQAKSYKPQPLKEVYRVNLIEKLKEASINELQNDDKLISTSWLKKINPFSKKET